MNIDSIDEAILTGVVRHALGFNNLQIERWESAPLNYRVMNPVSGGLHRLSGTAHDGAKLLPWSVILKIVRRPDQGGMDDPSHANFWRREALAYQSGVLADLPEGLTSPRCFGVLEAAPSVLWLWLEDIADRFGSNWPRDRYLIAARHLGQFNGAYLAGRPLPASSWISQGWLRSSVAQFVPSMSVLEQPDLWEHPLIRSAFPPTVPERLRRLCMEREGLLTALDGLPQTFCHWDAWQPNLLARLRADGQEETVAIDWAFAGLGPVGAEVGQLIAMALINGAIPPAAICEFAPQALEQYLAGLRGAGWDGEMQAVQLGSAALIALRWGLMICPLLSSALDESRHAWVERISGRPVEAVVQHWGGLSSFLLDQADEAQKLIG